MTASVATATHPNPTTYIMPTMDALDCRLFEVYVLDGFDTFRPFPYIAQHILHVMTGKYRSPGMAKSFQELAILRVTDPAICQRVQERMEREGLWDMGSRLAMALVRDGTTFTPSVRASRAETAAPIDPPDPDAMFILIDGSLYRANRALVRDLRAYSKWATGHSNGKATRPRRRVSA